MDHMEVTLFLSKLLTIKWNVKVTSQFQFDVFAPTKVDYPIVAEIFDKIKGDIHIGNHAFGLNQKKGGFVVYIKCLHRAIYDNVASSTQKIISECAELFESMTRDIIEVKKLTRHEVKCIFHLGVCFYMPAEVDCAVSTITNDQPLRPINLLFTRITNGYSSYTSLCKNTNLEKLIDTDTFMKMIHIVPSSYEFVVLYGELYQPLSLFTF